MIRAEDVVLVLLAAGTSERFGNIAAKLEEPFLGRPLGLHVAVALEAVPFRDRIAITGAATLDFAAHGFRTIANPDPARGMASSVKIGVEAAKAMDADAVLIALADMPRVTATHILNMLDAVDADDAVVASSDGETPHPPALFARDRFDALLALDGDMGARAMIRRGKHVVTTAAEMIDVDTPEELEQLRELVHDPEARTRHFD